MRTAITALVVAAAVLLTCCSDDSQNGESTTGGATDVNAVSSNEASEQPESEATEQPRNFVQGQPTTVDITGVLVVFDAKSGCQNGRGEDVATGDPISVVNYAGDTLATGQLGNYATGGGSRACFFELTIPDVTTAEELYAIVFGATRWEFYRSGLIDDDWDISIEDLNER